MSALVSDAAALPSDTSVAIVVRPAELAKTPLGQSVAALFDQLLAPLKLGLKVSEIEEFKAVLAGGLSFGPGDGEVPCAYMVLRSQRAHDWTKPIGELLDAAKVEEMDGHKYFRAANDDIPFGYWIADERTVVLGTLPGVARTFSTPDPNDQAPWEAAWKEVTASPVAGMVHMSLLGSIGMIGMDLGEGEEGEENEATPLAILGEDGDYVVFHADLAADGLALKALLACRSAEGAERVAPALAKGLAMVAGSVAPTSAVDDGSEATELGAQLATLVAATKFKADDTTVRIEGFASGELIKAVVASAQSAARSQALREASQQKMTAIAAAMTKYHDAQGHFPPAVALGPDGKTPYSWRVEILPYLEGGKELSERYRLNEPWDSDHNRQVMKDGAELFAAATDIESDDAIGCSYFLVTGKGTLYDGEPRPTRESVTDGAGKTITLVEARRAIAWTQSEDIAFDADAPLPQLGGNLNGVFAVACVDGSVKMMAAGTDEAVLRSMLSKAAGDGLEVGVVEPE